MPPQRIEISIFTTTESWGNIIAMQGTLIRHGERPFAGLPKAPFVDYIPQNRRRSRICQKTHRPYLLIVSGHDVPALPEILENNQPRYPAHDLNWQIDANRILNEWLKENPDRLIVGYRQYVSAETNDSPSKDTGITSLIPITS
jgi:hypothetical protein